MSDALLREVVVYLAAAVVAVPVAKRLGLGAVIGYLLAGVLIGPHGFGWIDDGEHTLQFAEFGVVLLLFIIGLELNPAKLWHMRRPIFGMGGAQVIITTGVFTGIGLALGWNWRQALVAAMALSLSSTAIALQSMTEKNLLNTPGGRSGFAVLLLQDIAVIPMLALMPLLGVPSGSGGGLEPWQAVLRGAGAIAMIVVGGHYLLRPAFRLIARVGMREVFTAFSLFIVIGTAVLMHTVGLSMALGTFLAGVLLADSEYRHQLETDVEPFKGLLLGLFFISVGMTIDFALLAAQPLYVLTLVTGLIVIKLSVLWLLGKAYRLETKQNLLFGLLLAQGGEFAFVLLAGASGILRQQAPVLILVVALSMLVTPVLIIIYMRWIEPRFVLIQEHAASDVEEQDNPVIIAGFGRFGQIVARLLHANGVRTTVIDHSPDHIARVRRFGFKIYYGDASRLDLLETAGAKHAKLLVLAMDNREQINQTAQAVHERFPHLTVLARAWDMVHAYELLDRGVTLFRRETFEAALSLGEDALKQLGMPAYQAKVLAHKFRQHDFETLYRQYAVHKDEEKLISTAQEAREELEKLFQADQKASHARDTSWSA